MLDTDKAPTCAAAIAELEAEGKCGKETRHRQVKYLDNVVEADHGRLEQLIRPVRGFKTMKTAYATIKGFEVMRALRKGQARAFALQGGIIGEARIVARAFGAGPCALTDAMRCGRTIWPTHNHEAPPRSARPPHAFVRFATERPSLWICRCAWTTFARCLHTHADSSRSLLLHEIDKETDRDGLLQPKNPPKLVPPLHSTS